MDVTGLGAACALLLAMLATSVDCVSPACRLEDCPNYRAIRHYEELGGCVRSDGSSQCCPTLYNCNCVSPACRLEDCPNYRAIRHYEELGGCVRSDGSSQCCPTLYNCNCESPACRLEDCPNYRAIRHYEELGGCVRSDGSSQCCPTRYDCSSFLSLEKTKCHYRGKAYEPGTQIPEEIISGCTPPCTCLGDPHSTFRGEAEFDCGHVDCPEYFESEPEPGCFRTYNVSLCCSTGVHCENATEGRQDVAECVYNGKRYLEGQYIEVPGPDCLTCVCQEGFNGTLEGPWCKKFICDYTLGQRLSELASCAPVFWDTGNCCPISWHCPSPEDTLVGRSEPTAENDHQCTFGNHRLNIGDELRAGRSPCIKCKCDIPPFVTCAQLEDSQCES